MGFQMPRGKRRNGRHAGVRVARVRGKEFAIRGIDPREHNVVSGFQCRQRIFRGLRIVKDQRGNTVGADDLSLRGKIPDNAGPEVTMSYAINAAQASRGRAADQHVHPGEFARDRIVLACGILVQSPDRPLRLTLAATFSSSNSGRVWRFPHSPG